VTAKVHRIRPKRHDVITEAVQLVLDLPLGLSDRTRDDLAEVLGKFAPPETWTFMKLNPDQQRYVLAAIHASPRPLATVMVWNACISRLQYDTGEVMASRTQLAEDAHIRPEEVSKALNRLVEIGALLRLRAGRYAINPNVGWMGDSLKRQEAAKDVPPVRLIEP
jgi:hypothetical protein